MSGKLLMVQGTASHVGKSVVAAALCRIFRDMGFRVAPFKAQNMSNNSFVCADGGEIGRAQAVQAEACGIEPTVDMNPILLKPSADNLSQVVFMGKPIGHFQAREYFDLRKTLHAKALESLAQLRDAFDLVVIEGAGSPAEVNLKEHDFANWGVAKAVDAPVIIVGDIDKGGVFAHLVGTWELLEADEKQLVRGFVINKFRGDVSLLQSGLDFLEARMSRPVLGVLPFDRGMAVPEEDSIPEGVPTSPQVRNLPGKVHVEAVRFPRLSNFTDLDAFQTEPDVVISYRANTVTGPTPDVVILPGSKATVADLGFLRESGLDAYVLAAHDRGIPVVGLCGGFQMLGRAIRDESNVESSAQASPGLGLLDCETDFAPVKTTKQVEGVHIESQTRVTGYEIHMGQTRGPDCSRPVAMVHERGDSSTPWPDGASRDGAWGTYLHGIFDEPAFRGWFLNALRRKRGLPERPAQTARHDPIGDWARTVKRNLRMELIRDIAGL